MKIAQYYAGVQIAASDGLWQAAQLLEEQANDSADPKFKAKQFERAKGAYKQLVNDFKDSQYVAKANERLAALSVP
jgi:DnaJ-domain-containing protein 1